MNLGINHISEDTYVQFSGTAHWNISTEEHLFDSTNTTRIGTITKGDHIILFRDSSSNNLKNVWTATASLDVRKPQF